MTKKEFIYLLQPREFIKTKEQIFKIGLTKRTVEERFGEYPKKSSLFYWEWCKNCRNIETEIIKLFKQKYIQRVDIGREYFEGNYKKMIEDIMNIIAEEENRSLEELNNNYNECKIDTSIEYDDENDLISKIKKELKDHRELYSMDMVKPENLWIEIQNSSIDKDFFDFIGKSITSNKKYCTNFEDVLEYLQYTRKDIAKHMLMSNFKYGDDFIILNKTNLSIHKDNIGYSFNEKESKSKHGGHNKEYIFLTKHAFYAFALTAETKKSKQIIKWMVDVYGNYQQLLGYARQKIILTESEKKERNEFSFLKQKIQNDYNAYKKKKNRQIANIEEAKDYYKTEYENFYKICQDNKIVFNEYTQILKEYEEEIKFRKVNDDIIIHIHTAIKLSADAEFIVNCNEAIYQIIKVNIGVHADNNAFEY